MSKTSTVGKRRIEALFDSGTFVETGSYVRREDGELTGVECGYGAIRGKLVYAFSQDSDRTKGAFDAIQAEKITALYRMAIRNGAPVIGLFDSAGAMVCDGSSALSAYGKVLKCVSDASGVIPQIAVVPGICAGMSATVAAMFDVTVTVKGQTSFFVNAPFLVGASVGTAEFTAQNGLSSIVAKDEAEALATAAELVSLLPSNNAEGVIAEESADDLNRRVSVAGLTGRDLLGAIADGGKYLELGAEYAPELLTALTSFGGIPCGVVANNPGEKNGAVSGDAAKKAARLIGICDSFSVPVLTLVDSVGTLASAAEEGNAMAAQLGKLAMAYASAATAKVTVVTGKAYGAAFTLMGSRALGADLVYALPDAEISVMAPEAAVAFLWNGQITETVSRADLVQKWKETCASPAAAAKNGDVDDVIAPEEMRKRICSALNMLMMKNEILPDRRHCDLPL